MPYNVTAGNVPALLNYALPRLSKKCRWEGDCLVWTGSKVVKGYGMIRLVEFGVVNTYTVHRLSWMIANKKILHKKRHVLHTCDNPSCFNPFHLVIGSHADNMADAAYKERMIHGIRHPQAKLTKARIEAAREIMLSGMSQTAAAQVLCVAQSTLSRALNGLTWFHSTN